MNRLRELRKEKELTLIELSKLININKSSIARFETGESIMSSIELEVFSNFYGVSVDYILGKNDLAINIYNEALTLTESQKQDILKYIKFIKEVK